MNKRTWLIVSGAAFTALCAAPFVIAQSVSRLPPVVLPLTGGELVFVDQQNPSAPTGFSSRQATINQVIGTASNFANPTASVGLAVVNGATTKAMRSDAAPALSQSIAPTWTGLHNFTGGIQVNGAALMLGAALTTTGTGAPTLAFPSSTAIYTYPPATATLASLTTADQTVSGGANVTQLGLTTGNVTIDCGARPLQSITNGGAFTITVPANDGSCMLLVTNNASAGAITFSGFSVGASIGDALTTTNTSKFTISIWRINGTAGYRVAAHQ